MATIGHGEFCWALLIMQGAILQGLGKLRITERTRRIIALKESREEVFFD
jgi:hypothetical protein